MLVATGVVAISLALTGCGDMQPEDLGELFDQTRDIIDQVEDAVDDTAVEESEFDETMDQNREWESYPPPPDLPELAEPFESYTKAADGSPATATEQRTYGMESLETVTSHYEKEYGSAAESDDGELTWTDGDSTTTVSTTLDRRVKVKTTWDKP